jgi:sarcosine oxidase gamma subunit
VLELGRSEAFVLCCLARPEELDALSPVDGAFACRVAPDELFLVAPADAPPAAAEALEERDPHALAVDQSSGWSVWTLAGPDVESAFARLSEIPPPRERPAFVQGAIAEVPAKAIFLEDRIHVLVPSSASDHLRMRVLTACTDLDPHEREPAPLQLATQPSALIEGSVP